MSDPWLDDVVSQVRDWDDARERSQQKELGWSGMADCRAYMGYRLREEWPTEERDTWRAIVGTSLHEWLGGVRSEAMNRMDGTDDFIEWELPVTYLGIPGHADEVNWTQRQITDYKFPSLASARVWDDPEVLDERFIQAQGYAAGVISSEYWRHLHGSVTKATVRVLVAPVDGTFDDWRTYTRPFDRDVADSARARYQQVVDATALGEDDLPRDKPWWWCERFCEFYSLCRGENPSGLPEVTDPELAAMIERYGIAAAQASAAEKVKKELYPALKGGRGQARGWKLYMTRGGAGKLVPDETAMAARFERSNMEVPMKSVPGKPRQLRVARVSSKDGDD